MKANRKQVACDCQLYTHMCMKAQTDTHAAYKAHRWKYKTTLIILRYWENGEVKRDTMQWLMIENSLNKVRMWQNSQSVQRTVKQVSYSLSGTGGVFYPGCEIKARLFLVPSGALVTEGSGVPRTLKRAHIIAALQKTHSVSWHNNHN